MYFTSIVGFEDLLASGRILVRRYRTLLTRTLKCGSIADQRRNAYEQISTFDKLSQTSKASSEHAFRQLREAWLDAFCAVVRHFPELLVRIANIPALSVSVRKTYNASIANPIATSDGNGTTTRYHSALAFDEETFRSDFRNHLVVSVTVEWPLFWVEFRTLGPFEHAFLQQVPIPKGPQFLDHVHVGQEHREILGAPPVIPPLRVVGDVGAGFSVLPMSETWESLGGMAFDHGSNDSSDDGRVHESPRAKRGRKRKTPEEKLQRARTLEALRLGNEISHTERRYLTLRLKKAILSKQIKGGDSNPNEVSAQGSVNVGRLWGNMSQIMSRSFFDQAIEYLCDCEGFQLGKGRTKTVRYCGSDIVLAIRQDEGEMKEITQQYKTLH